MSHEYQTAIAREVTLVPEDTSALPEGTRRLLGALSMLSIMLDNPYDECIIDFSKKLVGQ